MVLAGIVVDDAIVVLENIERIMESEGVDVRTATNPTVEEVTAPLVLIVLYCLFIPMSFLAGLAGQMCRPRTKGSSICVAESPDFH